MAVIGRGLWKPLAPLDRSHARVTRAAAVSGDWPHTASGPAEFRFRKGRGSTLGRGRNGARRVSQFRRCRRRSCCRACWSPGNQVEDRPRPVNRSDCPRRRVRHRRSLATVACHRRLSPSISPRVKRRRLRPGGRRDATGRRLLPPIDAARTTSGGDGWPLCRRPPVRSAAGRLVARAHTLARSRGRSARAR